MRISGALVAAVAIAATASPALAANIVYTKDHNVFVTSPDGGVQRQITTNGAVDNSYRSPSEKNDGTIVVPHSSKFWFLFGLDGSSRGGPWTAFAMNSCSTSPTASHVAPDGGLIVYTFLYSNVCLGGSTITPRTTFANSNSPTAEGQYPVYDGWWEPRWVPGTNIAAMIAQDGDTIGAQSGAGIQGFLFADPNEEFKSFDISRTGNRLLIVTTTDNATSGPGTLSVWQKDSPPPAADGHLACISPNAVDWDSEARWSPDGTMITWATSQGVYVSPAPADNGGGACALSPRLIAAGGSDPDWGTADVPAAQQQTTTTTTTTTTGDRTAPQARAAVARQSLRKALKKGLVVKLTTNEPGTAALQAKLKKKLVAKGAKKLAKPGTFKVVLKFKKKAKRQLRRKRSVKLVVTTVVADAAGNRTTTRKSVKLRR